MSRSKTTPGEPRFAELDGLRALAVVSVILFHCEVSGLLSAGFFGVDIFFMISGFIITAKLMDEFREKGDFRFSTFYFRRLKRLLPPVVGLIVLAAATVPTAGGAFDQFRSDVPAALAYVSNWWQIWHEQSYFDTTPLVLKHLWSLAVEEQFYFVWPLLAWCALKRFGEKATGVLALLLALASTAWWPGSTSPTSTTPSATACISAPTPTPWACSPARRWPASGTRGVRPRARRSRAGPGASPRWRRWLAWAG